MALRDLISGETKDAMQAADSAMRGRSMTGLSGLHTEVPPIAGRMVEPPRVQRIGPDGPAASPRAEAPLPPRPAPMEGERIPFEDLEQKMAWPARPGYRRYWFNDVPGRIARALRAGYTHVLDPDSGGHAEVMSDKGAFGGRNSYLMEIPMQWYQEDMARNAEREKARLDDLRNGRAGPGADDNRYIPSTGIRIDGR